MRWRWRGRQHERDDIYRSFRRKAESSAFRDATLDSRFRGDDIVIWTEICAIAEIPVLGSRVVRREAAGDIAIFRNGEDGVFALLDRCPHKGGPLSQGIVFGERVACPLHNWTIELSSGCAMAPDEGCTKRFALRVEAGRVYLETSALDVSTPVDAATLSAAA